MLSESIDWLDYELPPDRIAQFPSENRDQSRLMVLNRRNQTISHHHFFELPSFLSSNDLIVRNNSKVLPARLLGYRVLTGAKWEGLFLKEISLGTWEILMQCRGKLQIGERIKIEHSPLELDIKEKKEKSWIVSVSPQQSAIEILSLYGQIPLPPYIRKGRASDTDSERYQTVFAKSNGSIAAPTAGLHFSNPLIEELDSKGISQIDVTLHVGIGTFESIRANTPQEHTMHYEWCEVSEEAVQQIKFNKSVGGKILAVGTTATRSLETAARFGEFTPFQGETNLFIYPPYSFRVVDALITNFHLPRTTLLLLVAAFGGSDLVRRAYEEAIAHGYRFFSYGDAMLIL